MKGIDEDKWKYIAPSSIDGLKVRNIDNGFEFSFWAGGSGTNNMAIDSTGGTYDLSFYKNYTFENGMSIWLVRLFRNLNQSTDLTWRINYIPCYVPLNLKQWKNI